jgi:hypothetical protein
MMVFSFVGHKVRAYTPSKSAPSLCVFSAYVASTVLKNKAAKVGFVSTIRVIVFYCLSPFQLTVTTDLSGIKKMQMGGKADSAKLMKPCHSPKMRHPDGLGGKWAIL